MKPSLPQGTRDFAPDVVRKRQYILQNIKSVFEQYGFQPLETPAMENLDTLLGKYGEEGDKLIFKILNNGLENPAKQEQTRTALENVLNGKSSKHLTERALRYDLTIPFARFVALNHAQLTMPFKRYQIQPVWRADRPQKGRYREFYQCDADVVGSQSLLNEIDLIHIYARAFQALKIPIEIKINNRKILAALAQACGGQENLINITVAIDKLDKIGLEAVKKELEEKGLQPTQIELIETYLQAGNDIAAVESLLKDQPLAEEGFQELNYLLDKTKDSIQHYSDIELVPDFTLARGLNYYTGTIFEIKAKNVQIGSIGGGGRYDDLTGLFGVKNVPGVGISFGVDRIYDVMEELNLFPEQINLTAQYLFFHLGEEAVSKAMELAEALRNKGIACEVFHEAAKMQKQFTYAEKKGIPFVLIIGEEEVKNKTVNVKNIKTGEQASCTWDELMLKHS